ncbi:hypothetical protein RSAG8_12517, partial [Rhizoctonia solani AG-8 WAC10335]
MSNLKCICPGLDRYLNDAEACMRTEHCLYYLWIEAFRDVQTACSRLQSRIVGPDSEVLSENLQTQTGPIGPPLQSDY